MSSPPLERAFELGSSVEVAALSAGAALILTLILCFRTKIDRWAFERFLLSPSECNMSMSLRVRRLEQQNTASRLTWVMLVYMTLFIVLVVVLGGEYDVFEAPVLVLMLVVVPTAAATSSAELHAKYGWVNQVLHIGWIITRFTTRTSSGTLYQNQKMAILCGIMIIFTWNELSLRSLSMLLFNHVLVLAAMPLAWHFTGNMAPMNELVDPSFYQTRFYTWCPVLSPQCRGDRSFLLSAIPTTSRKHPGSQHPRGSLRASDLACAGERGRAVPRPR
jgi:hypothetical protein